MRISDWSSDVCSSDLVGAAYDIGHPLPGIVQHHGQLISKEPVATANHEIADFTAQVLAELTLYAVAEVIRQLRNAQADGRVFGVVTGVAAQIGRASCRERVCQYG